MFERFSYVIYRRVISARRRVTRRLTGAGLTVGAGLAVTAMLGLDTEQSLAYQSFALLACLMMVSSLFSFFFRARFTAERFLPRFGSVGDRFSYRVVLRNRTERAQAGLLVMDGIGNDLPTFMEFQGALRAARRGRASVSLAPVWSGRAEVSRVALPVLGPGGEAEVEVEVMPRRRGQLLFDAVTVGRADPLGLVRALVRIPSVQSVLILPKRYRVPPVALSGEPMHQPGGVALSSSVGDSQEFVFLRDYRRGDPLRHVHWKSWARTGRPIVKEFQNEYFVRHALVLDTFHDGSDEEVFEEAVSVAASYACTIETQESLLDLMFVGTEAYCFTAGRGLAYTEQILEILASVQGSREGSFEVLRDLVLGHAAALSGCICILQGWDERRRELVRQLEQSNVPVMVLVVTPQGAELGLEDRPVRFHQLEVGKIEEGLNFGREGAG